MNLISCISQNALKPYQCSYMALEQSIIYFIQLTLTRM